MNLVLYNVQVGLRPAQREAILNDFERGQDHIQFEALIKLSIWEQLPLSLCCIGYVQDVDVAKRCLRRAIAQFESTSDMQRHGDLVKSLLASQPQRTETRRDFDEWLLDGTVCANFSRWRYKMRGVRVNEVSVESLHRQGHRQLAGGWRRAVGTVPGCGHDSK